MDESLSQQARAILRAAREARRDLAGNGPAKKRADAARMHFYAYTSNGPLSAHVRDVYYAAGVGAMQLALSTLESLAQACVDEGDTG